MPPEPPAPPRLRTAPTHLWTVVRVVALVAVVAHTAMWLLADGAPTRVIVNCAMSVLAFGVSSTLLTWAALRSLRVQPAATRVWAGVAVSQLALLVPNTIWLAVVTIPGLRRLTLDALEGFFLLVGPALLGGLFSVPTRRGPPGERIAWGIELFVVALAGAVLAWNIVSMTTGATGTWAAVGEIAIATVGFAVLGVVLFRPLEGQARAPLLWVAAGLACSLVDAAAYALQAPQGTYDNSGVSVLFMAAGAWLMGLGGLRQVRSCEESPLPTAHAPPAAARVGRWLPIALVAGASLMALATPGLPPAHLQLGLVAVAMATLLMVRQLLSLRRIDSLNEQLRAANLHLEARIEARTADLVQANADLLSEIRERHRVEEALLERERRLAEVASRDGLTGLLNRSFFQERLGQVLARARREGAARHAVLFLDLDSFKLVNDSLGHRVGDQLLVQIARRVEAVVRSSDVVARLGGDEFVVLLDGVTDTACAAHTADRIQAALNAPMIIDGYPVHCTASIGVVMGRVDDGDVTDVIRDADLAMYQAKMNGKGRSALFSVELHTAALARLTLETDLRTALESGELSLEYQPIHSLVEGRITGFEALIRWDHPGRGRVPPSVFIPVAESTGMIVPIGQWVLEQACRQLAEWRREVPGAGALTVSVNPSPRQFGQRDLPEGVAAALEASGLPAAALRVEITESAILGDADGAEEMFARVRALGVQVLLDDFGVGYSSLAYLHRFPLDGLKVDRSFVSRLGAEGDNAQIIGTIVGLAHALGLTVTAEGVETVEQRDRLAALRCEYIQGYLISRPQAPERVPGLIVASAPVYTVSELAAAG